MCVNIFHINSPFSKDNPLTKYHRLQGARDSDMKQTTGTDRKPRPDQQNGTATITHSIIFTSNLEN